MRQQMILAVIAALVLRGGIAILPDVPFSALFCRLPAEAAACYYATEPDQALTFTAHDIAIQVTRNCGAADFCAMVFGCYMFALLHRRRPFLLPAALPAAWLTTLLANTCRLILIVPVTSLLRETLPEKWQAAGHHLFGTLVFLPFLLLVWYSCHPSERTSP